MNRLHGYGVLQNVRVGEMTWYPGGASMSNKKSSKLAARDRKESLIAWPISHEINEGFGLIQQGFAISNKGLHSMVGTLETAHTEIAIRNIISFDSNDFARPESMRVPYQNHQPVALPMCTRGGQNPEQLLL